MVKQSEVKKVIRELERAVNVGACWSDCSEEEFMKEVMKNLAERWDIYPDRPAKK